MLGIYDRLYSLFSSLFISRVSAQRAHHILLGTLRGLDRVPALCRLGNDIGTALSGEYPHDVGGVRLSRPLILAAGLVKGDGFANEQNAMLAAADPERNIIPGWRSIPSLVGPVEYGSFTRYSRQGNAGTVVWRHAYSRSLQNRVGLKNPGARAAAKFLGARKHQPPAEFGINIAVSPGVTDVDRQETEVIESLEFFLDEGVLPNWFTLNLSCPNTEDDPLGHQLEAETRQLCGAFINNMQARSVDIPLWIKVSPGLAEEQYQSLVRVCHEVGVRAIVATNTMAKPSPDDPELTAGVGGGELFDSSLAAVQHLRAEIVRKKSSLDVIACGGILDGESFQAYRALGIRAAQYWSALVYRGPLAAAVIESELVDYEYEYEALHRESLA